MGQAPGELADGLHLLRLAQQLLGAHQIGRALGDALFQGLVEGAKGGGRPIALRLDGTALLHVDKDAREGRRRAVRREVHAAVRFKPVVVAVRAPCPVLVRVGPTACDRLVDGKSQGFAIVGVDGRDDLRKWKTISAEPGIQAEAAGKSLVHGEPVGRKIPMPRADDRACREGKLDALDVFARDRLARAQTFFRDAPCGNIAEEDGDPPLGRVAHPDGAHVEPALEGFGVVLKRRRFAGFGNMPVGLEPEPLEVRGEFGDPLAAQVDPGLTLESGVGFDEAVVDGLVVGIELDLDDGKGGVDRFQDRSEALLARGERVARRLLCGDVPRDTNEPEWQSGFVALDLAFAIDPAQFTRIRPANAILDITGILSPCSANRR